MRHESGRSRRDSRQERKGLKSAQARIDEAAEAAGTVPSIIALGRVHHARAALAWTEDDLEGAESAAHDALGLFAEAEHLQGVVDAIERLAALLACLESYAEAARLLGAAQAARDAICYVRFPADVPAFDEAAQRCRVGMDDEAFGSAYAEGLRLELQEAVAYASRGRGSRKRPSTGWASLTPAELDVVRLVAEGLSNADIGKRLFISPRTVQAHLAPRVHQARRHVPDGAGDRSGSTRDRYRLTTPRSTASLRD